MRLLTLFRLPFFAALRIALAALLAGQWLVGMLALLAAAVVFGLGRDPVRDVPSRPLGVVSPVDGRVIACGDHRDPFLDRDAFMVRVRQGVIDPAVLHSPIEGRVEHIWGGNSMPDAATPAVAAVHVRTPEGDDVVFSLSRPWLPGPLNWKVQPGERVGQGQRRGLAGWGRVVTVYAAGNCRAEVQCGNRVHAGVDVIARLVHTGRKA